MSQSKKEVLSLEQKWIGFSNAISKASLNGFEGFLAGEEPGDCFKETLGNLMFNLRPLLSVRFIDSADIGHHPLDLSFFLGISRR